MKVFVAGATGYIGSAVCDALLGAGCTVLGLARSARAARTLERRHITPFRGDLEDPESLARAAEQTDAVIYAADGRDFGTKAIDLSAVGALLDAQRETAKTFIYTSAIWIYGNTGNTHITESTKFVSPYPRWRELIEDHVFHAALDGIRAIVIRPGVVFGRGGGLPAMFVQTAKEFGTAKYIGTGENHWPVVHVDALAQLYVLALMHARPATAWVAAHGNSLPVRDIARAASQGAGACGRVEGWPLATAKIALGNWATWLTLDQRADGGEAKRLLNWAPECPDILDDLRSGSYTR